LKPVRADGPPIWIGARHPDSLRRAVRIADGWISAGGSSSTDFHTQLAIVHEALAAAPPRDRPFGIGKRVYLAIGRNQARDRARLRTWFDERYGDPDRAERVAIASDARGIVDAVAPLIEAGAGLILLNPVYDHRRQLETLAADVAPELRKLRPGS
jgi:alkanesulfonate monooxygenase SsuD/methylene tetrahydromethanopterin reductase-like flavin-dependent oxidoreductase (luciferase family)